MINFLCRSWVNVLNKHKTYRKLNKPMTEHLTIYCYNAACEASTYILIVCTLFLCDVKFNLLGIIVKTFIVFKMTIVFAINEGKFYYVIFSISNTHKCERITDDYVKCVVKKQPVIL